LGCLPDPNAEEDKYYEIWSSGILKPHRSEGSTDLKATERARAHEGENVLDGGHTLVLGGHGAAGGDQGFACGVRDQMKVEVTASQNGLARHRSDRGLWIAVDSGRQMAIEGHTALSGDFSQPS
jgi:hypothetical protein